MDSKTLLVADHQQWRIFQILAVVSKLGIGGGQVFMLPLVLPCEIAALPYVRLAFAAPQLGDVFFKREGIASRIGGGGMRLPKQFAEVDEMTLRCGTLGKLAGFPAFNKFRQSERCAGHGKLAQSYRAGPMHVVQLRFWVSFLSILSEYKIQPDLNVSLEYLQSLAVDWIP